LKQSSNFTDKYLTKYGVN